MKTLVRERNLTERVTFTGMLAGELKWSALAAARCFVLPSYSEGLSVSVLEAIALIETLTQRKLAWHYVEEARKGDHICYISNLAKFKRHYPNWKITRGLDTILEEIIASQREQLN